MDYYLEKFQWKNIWFDINSDMWYSMEITCPSILPSSITTNKSFDIYNTCLLVDFALTHIIGTMWSDYYLLSIDYKRSNNFVEGKYQHYRHSPFLTSFIDFWVMIKKYTKGRYDIYHALIFGNINVIP